jgi:single-strand selective monofunctional uracil DNA glycosylase
MAQADGNTGRARAGAKPDMDLTRIARALTKELSTLRFSSPVTHIYNPLTYARSSYARYVDLYGRRHREIVMLGMNPGPWGMAQTGVPFGEVHMVRAWLGIHARVGKPEREHPKRPVEGFDCRRSEISGRRIWCWARDHFRTPQRFFDRFFIANYCPLAFLEASGRNRTPDKLLAEERGPLLDACDRALCRTIEYLRPRCVVGIGRFAAGRAEAALAGTGIRVVCILHPSPASPAANQGWARQANAQLRRAGLLP